MAVVLRPRAPLPAQHCTCAVSTDCHTKFLQQIGVQESGVSACARSRGAGYLQEYFARSRLPHTTNLRHHGNQLDALRLAQACCVQVGRLVLSVSLGSRKCLVARLSESLLPLWGRNGQVKSSRRTPQAGQVHIRGALQSITILLRVLWEKKPWAGSHSLSPPAEKVADCMVAQGMVAACAAGSGMQRARIQDAVTLGAPIRQRPRLQVFAGAP